MNSKVVTLTTGAMTWLNRILKTNIRVHGEENIPAAPVIFVANHFTRFETFLLPWYLQKGKRADAPPVCSLAHHSLFAGKFGAWLRDLGAISTTDPDRDGVIVRSLITNEARWIIFPEGSMIKDKKVLRDGRIMVRDKVGYRAPHTGAATLALRAEFYRRRLLGLSAKSSPEAERLLASFGIETISRVSCRSVVIVPVNISYYPLRARENFLNRLAARFVTDIPGRMREELMVEGEMLFGGVDIDIRFGRPVKVEEYLNGKIMRDIDADRKILFDDPIASRDIMRMKSRKIMLRYMKAIYGLATVNHDNIFASILWHARGDTIEEDDFRRIAFLAAAGDRRETRVYLHEDIGINRLGLLVGHAGGHYRDFLALAESRGIVRQNGRRLHIDRDKLTGAVDFHNIRIENPLAPLYNEVEFLERLQRKIKEFSGTPSEVLRAMVRDKLLAEAADEFKNDYDRFSDAEGLKSGQIKKREVGEPFLLTPERFEETDFEDRVGAVLAHGYMAAPLEVRQLAEYLLSKGLAVYAPRLKGHGTSPADLAGTQHEDWAASVERGYAIMSNCCRRVILGGFSTGAGLILDLAARVREIEGVFAVCAPLRLKTRSSCLAPCVSAWNRAVPWEGIKWQYVGNNPENPHINYGQNPIAGVKELRKLMNRVEKELPRISAPALVVQSLDDPVVDHRGGMRLYLALGSEKKKYSVFGLKRHNIINGADAQCVFRDIWDFIAHLIDRP